jgi:outer membrane murein-binding lipoprotein Lpp
MTTVFRRLTLAAALSAAAFAVAGCETEAQMQSSSDRMGALETRVAAIEQKLDAMAGSQQEADRAAAAAEQARQAAEAAAQSAARAEQMFNRSMRK